MRTCDAEGPSAGDNAGAFILTLFVEVAWKKLSSFYA